MYLSSPSLLHNIYAKTSKGHDEIVRPRFGLNPRQRRILTFVDGVRTLVALYGHFPPQEIEDIACSLAGQDFICLVGKQSQETASSWLHASARDVYTWNENLGLKHTRGQKGANPVLTQDPEKVSKAKEFMLEIAAIHLGILGREIIQKIDTAQCSASLASLAGQWTMALCASKTAARYAQLYLEQLKCMLFEEQHDGTAFPLPETSSSRHLPSL